MDLYQYLHYFHQEQPTEAVRGTTTIYFARQIVSALAYLESLRIVHRDVAARNCFVSTDLHVKLHDLAMCNETYADDYVSVTAADDDDADLPTRRPVRWCAWETICLVSTTSHCLFCTDSSLV